MRDCPCDLGDRPVCRQRITFRLKGGLEDSMNPLFRNTYCAKVTSLAHLAGLLMLTNSFYTGVKMQTCRKIHFQLEYRICHDEMSST